MSKRFGGIRSGFCFAFSTRAQTQIGKYSLLLSCIPSLELWQLLNTIFQVFELVSGLAGLAPVLVGSKLIWWAFSQFTIVEKPLPFSPTSHPGSVLKAKVPLLDREVSSLLAFFLVCHIQFFSITASGWRCCITLMKFNLAACKWFMLPVPPKCT